MSHQDAVRLSGEERREAAALGRLSGAVGIRGGVQCHNNAVDQALVISMLGNFPAAQGGTQGGGGAQRFKVPRNGFCEPSLAEAIRRFQAAQQLKADGVVDVGGPTFRRLEKGPSASPSPAAGAAGISEAELAKVHQLLDIGTALARNPFLDRVLPGASARIQSALRALEAEMKAKGVPLGTRNIPVQNNVLALGGIVIGVEVVIAVGVAAVLLQITVLQRIYRDILVALLKTFIGAMLKIDRVIIEGLRQRGRGRCSDDNFRKYSEAKNNLITALEMGHSSRVVLSPLFRAWHKALIILMQCMDSSTVGKVFVILEGVVAGGIVIMEFIEHYIR